ncbi:hypothetical protein HER21_35785, partial [Pseudomonas sp. BGM005]|nr:hypothetical protein [Pseudomonas sp. BG5]
KELDELPVAASVETARLTFRGKPVSGSHGIAAEFAGKAARAFSDAFNAISAGMRENLNYMGPIPEKGKNRLLITGTAVGSFGFEFEVPSASPDAASGKQPHDALYSLQRLMEVSAEGADEEIAELVQVVH